MVVDIEGTPLGAAGGVLLLTCQTLRLLCFSSSDWSPGDFVGHLSATSAVLSMPNSKAEEKDLLV